MEIIKNILITGAAGRPIALDIFYEEGTGKKPVVIYSHGFNGFKDWGNFDLIATRFAKEGFVFVKFNFSHNGTTPDHPEEFTDLELFGSNNYSKELEDLGLITAWVLDPLNPFINIIDSGHINLLGHSLGGGMAILHAARDKRIYKLVTWASISECKTPWGSWPPDKMAEWKLSGVQYYINSRTHQEMPLYYQLFEDFENNKSQLSIKEAISSLTIPVLICHGKVDNAVPVENAYLLNEWQPASKLFILETDHVFGRRHPWPETWLPSATEYIVNESIQFLR